MNIINIKTWNVNWFRGKKSGSKYNKNDQSEDSYNHITININTFLNKENSAVILQEVPYKIKNGNSWEVNEFYTKLCKNFPQKEYEIVTNIKENDFVVRTTVAIFKKGLFKKITDYNPFNNRTVGLMFGSISILGIHMPTGFEEKNDDKDNNMWNELINYTAKCKEENRKLVIAGDFNAFIGCKDTLTESKYIQLCRSAKDLVSDDTPTFIGETAIDHILINYNSNQNFNVKIQDECKWSDHKYIEVELRF